MDNSINTKELIELLKVTPPEQNIMLAGRHGIGKSQIITDYFTKKKMKVVVLFLGQMCDPGDLIGLPHYDEASGLTTFSPPYWFPTDNNPIVLFLDELNRARQEILQTIMDLALNKTLAGRPLPAGSRIVSAVNSGDEYQLTDLDPALVSRFNIYTFKPSTEEWIKWAIKKGFDSRILHYIQIKPGRLDSWRVGEDEDNLAKTPDRRAWEKVNGVLKSVDELKPIHAKILSGIIGPDIAIDFVTTESIREKNKITGFEVLEKGSEIFVNMAPYQIFEFSEIITSIFEILNTSDSFIKTKNEQYIKNLTDFVDWLSKKQKYEVLAYFTSVFTEGNYPVAKNFLCANCESLIDRIMTFVKDYTPVE